MIAWGSAKAILILVVLLKIMEIEGKSFCHRFFYLFPGTPGGSPAAPMGRYPSILCIRH